MKDGPKATLAKRRQHIWIGKLKRLNCYDRMLQKLVDGESASQVAVWLHELKPEGELADCSVRTLRQYVGALSSRVKECLGHVDRTGIEPLAFRVLVQELEKEKGALVVDDLPMTVAARKVLREVTEAVEKVDSGRMLKYAFMVQLGRVEMLLRMEGQMNLLMPGGWKNLAVLKDIAAEVRKHEAGEQWLDGKGKVPDWGMFPDGLLPHGQTGEDIRREKGSCELDEVERNRWRAAAVRVVEMIKKDAGELFEIGSLGVAAAGAGKG